MTASSKLSMLAIDDEISIQLILQHYFNVNFAVAR